MPADSRRFFIRGRKLLFQEGKDGLCLYNGPDAEASYRRDMGGGIRYFGSQPWPFPNSLMIGFFAEASGSRTIHLSDEELEDARWFPVDGLPCLPDTMSIARRLIDAFLANPV